MTVDELYNRYLNKKLDLIFNDNGQIVTETKSIIPPLRLIPKYNYESEMHADYCTRSIMESAVKKFPGLEPYLDSDLGAIYLHNGIYGTYTQIFDDNHDYYYKCFFPELNMEYEAREMEVKLFPNGFFVIGNYLFDKERKIINVNSKGKDVHYTMIPPGYIRVEYNDGYKKMYNLIDNEGNLYDNTRNYYDIYSNGGLIFMQDNDPEEEYHSKNQKLYKILLNNGELLDGGNLFNEVKRTEKGNYIARVGDTLFLFNQDGKNIKEGTGSTIKEFLDYRDPALYLVKGPLRREKIIDENGIVFAKRDFFNIRILSENYAEVEDDKADNLYELNGSKVKDTSSDYRYMIVNKDGVVLHNNKGKKYNSVYGYYNCVIYDDKGIIVERKGKLKEYDIVKTLFGYRCRSEKDSFTTKHQPVMKYSDTFVLCIDKNQRLQMFNRQTGEYKDIGHISDVNYNDSFITIDKHIIYPYKDQLINVDSYFKKNLSSKIEVRINEDIGEILTKEEFKDKYKDKLNITESIFEEDNSKIIAEQRRREEAKKAYLERKKQEEELRVEMENQVKENERRLALKESYLKQLKDVFDGLAAMGELSEMNRIKVKDLYETVEDHLEIRREYRPYLKVIDLKDESFKNVKISGLDFTDTNIRGLNPQIVYQKDLSNCDFTGIYFQPFTMFNGVNLEGTKLSYDNNSTTIDLFNSSIKQAIYDENTRINNKTVEEFFEKKETNNKTANR